MPREIPIVFLEVDAINVTTLPSSPRAGYSLLVAASGTVGPLIGRERQIATYDVNAWIYTPLEKLAGKFILYKNPGTGLVKAYVHTGALVLTLGTEEFVTTTVDAAVATKADAADLEAVEDDVADIEAAKVDIAAIAAKEAELVPGQLMIYKGEGEPMEGIPLPTADDAPRAIRAVRNSGSGAMTYSFIPE